jgi:nitrate reductase alpha subunit
VSRRHGAAGRHRQVRHVPLLQRLALLDAHVRGVDEQEAKGGRTWSNYTWHGDQAPGHPFTTGLQASDEDFNDLRNSRLHIQCGKNLVENKMAESHFFVEVMERGAKIVTITPEYSPPATKSDYWIPIRPATDTALFLGITRWLMDNEKYNADFVKRFTDFPCWCGGHAQAAERGGCLPRITKLGLDPSGPSFAQHGLTQEQYEKLGDYVVRDADGEFKAVTREDVGDVLTQKGIDPVLDWSGTVKLIDGSEVEVLTLWAMHVEHYKTTIWTPWPRSPTRRGT